MEVQPVEIAGAGPAGLAAAITLARAGKMVIVHEAHHEVGFRFRRDLQGLGNWTTAQNAGASDCCADNTAPHASSGC